MSNNINNVSVDNLIETVKGTSFLNEKKGESVHDVETMNFEAMGLKYTQPSIKDGKVVDVEYEYFEDGSHTEKYKCDDDGNVMIERYDKDNNLTNKRIVNQLNQTIYYWEIFEDGSVLEGKTTYFNEKPIIQFNVVDANGNVTFEYYEYNGDRHSTYYLDGDSSCSISCVTDNSSGKQNTVYDISIEAADKLGIDYGNSNCYVDSSGETYYFQSIHVQFDENGNSYMCGYTDVDGVNHTCESKPINVSSVDSYIESLPSYVDNYRGIH